MTKVNSTLEKYIEDGFWDYYSGLPNPMWYQHITEIEDEEDTSDSVDTSATPE